MLGPTVCLLKFHWLAFFFSIFVLIRILATRNKIVIYCCFLSLFLLLLSITHLRIKESRTRFDEQIAWRGNLFVKPDQLEVDGDLLKVEGTVQAKERNKQKIVAFYRIKTKEELKEMQAIDQLVIISVSGQMETPLPKTNLNGFDYQNYLKQKGIYQLLQIEKITAIKKENIHSMNLSSSLSVLRKKAINYCNNNFLTETAMYFNIFLFGFKANEFSQKQTVLASLGILHLFSLSGMHVTFFLNKFRFFLLKLNITKEKVFWIELLFCFLYAGMTGTSISVIRALCQSSIKLFNRRFDFGLSQLDCWSCTLLICLLFSPYLLFSAGAQLSFGLSFFILYVYPIVMRLKIVWIRKICFSLLLSLVTIPVIGLSFFEWQATGSVFTFLLIPFFEKILLPIIFLSFISSFLLFSSSYQEVLENFFTLLQTIFEWFNQNTVFRIVTGHFPPILFLLSFIVILLLLDSLLKKSKKALLIFMMLLLIMNQKYFLAKGILAFVDIGQGDSIFIQTPFHTENILIDTGGRMEIEKERWTIRKKTKTNAENSLIPFLKSRGVKKMDKVFITHGHQDHFGDILILNEKIPIKEVYYPKGTEHKRKFQMTIQELKKSGTKCYSTLANTALDTTIKVKILAPKTIGTGENNDSLVLFSQIAGKRILFTGDLESQGEQKLIKEFPDLAVDILKVGHHGSKTSSSAAFIQTIQPNEGIISCGRNNRFGHPNQETITTLEKNQVVIYQTKEHGMIYYEWTPLTSLSDAKIILKSSKY